MNSQIYESEIHEILKTIKVASENGEIQEFLNYLIPIQKKYAKCLSIDELGLLRLRKSSCVHLADIYLNADLHSQAKIIYEFVLRYFPEENDIKDKYFSSILADAEEKINNLLYNEAQELLNELLKNNEKNVLALIDLGVLKVLEQKYEDAKILFQNVLEIEPCNVVALENYQFVMQAEKGKSF